MPTTTRHANGVLYAAWNDRPNGVGGDNNNATRIFMSVSRDGNGTWSAPQVISVSLDTRTMNDRFQPWITTDASGVHAMWYERVRAAPVNLIQTDKVDLTLATTRAGMPTESWPSNSTCHSRRSSTKHPPYGSGSRRSAPPTLAAPQSRRGQYTSDTSLGAMFGPYAILAASRLR